MDAFQPQSETPHRPLEPGEIRIVTLLPGPLDSPIHCTLEHVKLSELTSGSTAAAYQAVSYVWGDATQTQPITLDGAAYPVTTNLYSALNYLREAGEPTRLWVDSLCINQQDVFERSAQVGQMRAIFASAARVSVWLGDYGPHPKSDWHLGFQYMIARADWMSKPPKTPAEQHRFDTLQARHARGSEIMSGLLARPWFMRAWVVQEVAVRHFRNDDEKVKLMVGHLTVPWFAMDGAFGRLLYNRAPRPDGTLSDSYGAPNGLCSISKAWNYKHQLTLLAGEAKYVGFSEQLAMYLSRFTQFGATDQRDRIYSLLGMLVGNETVPDSLAPDYSKPASAVFHEYTAWMLREGGCVDVLGLSSGSPDGGPSWVPNFVGRRGVFYRNLEETSPVKLLDGDRLLEIEALPLTVVSAAGPRCSIRAESSRRTTAGGTAQDATEVFLEECRRYLSSCEDLLSVPPESVADSAEESEAAPATSRAKASKLARLKGWAKRASRVPEPNPTAAAAADTPTARQRLNKYFEDSFATSLMDSHWTTPLPPKQLYDVLMRGPADDDAPGNRVALSHPYGSYIADEFDGYSLFTCENGDVDFCRSTAVAPQAGDMVCLLRGSTHRYVLRPVGETEQWALVGTAYMDAEFSREWHRHGQEKEAGMRAAYASLWSQNVERGNVVQVVIR